jgi:hypothetical protein
VPSSLAALFEHRPALFEHRPALFEHRPALFEHRPALFNERCTLIELAPAPFSELTIVSRRRAASVQ